MDVQRTKESSDACQRSSSSQVDMFEAFPPAMAGESHGRAARGGIFGDAVQVVDGVLSSGRVGGVGGRNDHAMAFSTIASKGLRRECSATAQSLRRECSGLRRECDSSKSHFCTKARPHPSQGKLESKGKAEAKQAQARIRGMSMNKPGN